VTIFLKDPQNNILQTIAVSNTDEITQIEYSFGFKFSSVAIPLDHQENIITKAFTEKIVQVAHSLFDVFVPVVSEEKAKQIQEVLSIITIIVYPLIVRNNCIGAFVIALDLNENNLNDYQHDLRERLPGVVAVAMNNALLYQEIQQANEKLKALDKLKDEFVSLASHELRTPMTAIKSYLWMALAGKGGILSEKQKYYLDRAYNSTNRLIKLVNEMLNVSRIESGKIVLEQHDVDINHLADDIVADVIPRAQELGIAIDVEHVSSLPHVYADENKIKEVFINLIGNSLKFTSKNGRITVGFLQAGKMIEVSVTDTGKGIAPENITKLFQKFGIVDNIYLTTQNVQGTGLGLYVSKAIVELHGGKIWVHSEGIGKGTTFTFSLPVFEGQQIVTGNSDLGKEIIPAGI
jgi:signal transduction histidine kinase